MCFQYISGFLLPEQKMQRKIKYQVFDQYEKKSASIEMCAKFLAI